MNKSMTALLKSAFFIFVLVMVSGCVSTAGNFGNLRYDDQVKQTFENFSVPEGYKFYYSGPKTFPKAFVGISEEYTLESSLWTPVNLTPEMLRGWIWGQANRLQGDLRRYGSNIVGPSGQHIGVYYSLKSWQQWLRIEMVGDNTIKLGGPIDSRTAKRFSRYPF